MYKALFEKYITLASEEPNASGEIAGFCPFHDDTSPSFSFNVETGLWNCFNSDCVGGGDAPRLIMLLEGISRAEAEAKAATYLYGTEPLPTDEEVEEWHRLLVQSPAPLMYLAGRGITDRSLLERHCIGYHPDRRRLVIPVHDRDGLLVNLRLLRMGGHGPGKVINWTGRGNVFLWPISSLLEGDGPVYLCEGEIDCLSALQQGLWAVTATGGAGVWPRELSSYFRGLEIRIAYDGDKAGRDGARAVREALLPYAQSVIVLQLPDGEDVNSLHIAGTELASLVEEVATADEVEELIYGLPENLTAQEKLGHLERLAEVVSRKPKHRQQYYIDLAKEVLGVSQERMTKYIKAAQFREMTADVPEALLVPRKGDYFAAQDYRDGLLHYGIYLPTQSGKYTFRMIRADRQVLEVPEDKPLPPDTGESRWSVDRQTPYNVFAWLAGRTPPIDVAILFEDVRGVFQRFMWYPADAYYDVAALWAMASYVFMVLDSVAYLALTGTKRAGKSRTLELFKALCFNPGFLASGSASALFRFVHAARATLLIDEADVLAFQKDGGDERLAILRSGYRKGACVMRVEGKDGTSLTPRSFDVYGPKAVANVSGLEEALGDRAILLHVRRKPKAAELGRFISVELREEFQVLRNRLHCFGLEWANQIAEEYSKVLSETGDHGLMDRELEIWAGILAIARLVSEELYRRILEHAKVNQLAKTRLDAEMSLSAAVVLACRYLLEDEEETPDVVCSDGTPYYVWTRIRDKATELLGWREDRLSAWRLRNELVKTAIIADAPGYTRRLWDRARSQRGIMAYAISKDRVMDAVISLEVDPDLGAAMA